MTCPHSSSRSERLAARLLRRPGLEKIAVRALRRATHLLGLAIGTRLARMRDSDLSHNRLGAKIEEQVLLSSLLTEANRILAERWEKIPDRRRPPRIMNIGAVSQGKALTVTKTRRRRSSARTTKT